MDQLLTGLLPSTHLGHWEIATRLALAAFAGSLIGLDREFRARPAGIRTHMLVAMASALFAIVAHEIIHNIEEGSDAHGDPVRVIEAVTAGVAFLAAGAIIHSGNRVAGLTTGACLWLAGGAGLACGVGLWSIAAIAVVFGIVALVILGAIARAVSPDKTDPDESSRGRLSRPHPTPEQSDLERRVR